MAEQEHPEHEAQESAEKVVKYYSYCPRGSDCKKGNKTLGGFWSDSAASTSGDKQSCLDVLVSAASLCRSFSFQPVCMKKKSRKCGVAAELGRQGGTFFTCVKEKK